MEKMQTKDAEDTAILKEKIGKVQENTKDLMVEVKEEAEQESKTVCRFLTEDL